MVLKKNEIEKKLLFSMPGLIEQEARFSKLLELTTEHDHILIRGPRGVGKSFFVQSFMEYYDYKDVDVVEKNCATFPPDLASSELFGHVKGAFTGAISDKPGLIDAAASQKKKGKTLILQELNSLSEDNQAKLLVFMEKFTFYQVGGFKVKKAKVRIVATMNDETDSTKIRKDLIDRFKIVIDVPSLSERRQDIFYYIGRKYPNLAIDSTELIALYSYHWPGNFRDLERILWERQSIDSSIAALYGFSSLYGLSRERREGLTTITDVINLLIHKGFLTEEEYEEVNQDCFGGLFPLMRGLLSILPSVHICIDKEDSSYIVLRNDNPEKCMGIGTKTITALFEYIYGEKSVRSPKTIYKLEPFDEEAFMEMLAVLRRSRDAPQLLLSLDGFKESSIKSMLVFLKACCKMCASHSQTTSAGTEVLGTIDAHQVADFLIGEVGRFDAVFRECFHKLGTGSQKKLSKLFDVPTQTINNWCKKKNLT